MALANADVNLIETMGLQFINRNQSPGAPLTLLTLKRTEAVNTSIALINNLFLSDNENLTFKWIEIETELTGATHWDGVGFKVDAENKIGYCQVEFSGGIKKNCKNTKAGSDLRKLENGIISLLDFTNYNMGHFIRYHNMNLYFEVVYQVHQVFVRRTHTTVKLPTSPAELKDFLNKTEELFA